MYLIGVFAILLLGAANPCHAALSLHEAMEQAIAHAPDPQVFQAEQDALSFRSKAALAPASPSFGYVTGNIDTPNGAVTQTYSLSQSFGFPGKGLVQSQSLELDARAMQLSKEAKSSEIAALAKTRYYDLWLSERKLGIYSKRHDAYEKILALAKKRFVKNTSTEVEYLSAQVELQTLENERVDFEAGEEAARADLNLLLGNDPDASLTIEAPPQPVLPFQVNLQELRAHALEANPWLASVREQTRAKEKLLTAARLSALPDFTLSGAVDSENDKQVGIQLTFPLWYPFSQSREIDAARADRLAQELQAQTLSRTILEGLESQISILKSLSRKIENYRETIIPLSKTAFDKGLANYRFGKVSYSVLVMAADTWTFALLQYEMLMNQYAHVHAALEQSIGRVTPNE